VSACLRRTRYEGCGGLTSTCVKAATTDPRSWSPPTPARRGAGGHSTRYGPATAPPSRSNPHLARLDSPISSSPPNRQHSDESAAHKRTTDDQPRSCRRGPRSPAGSSRGRAHRVEQADLARILERCPTCVPSTSSSATSAGYATPRPTPRRLGRYSQVKRHHSAPGLPVGLLMDYDAVRTDSPSRGAAVLSRAPSQDQGDQAGYATARAEL